MRVNEGKMRTAAAQGFTNATDAADYLVKKGMPFRDAHKVIGEIVAYCISRNKAIEEMTISEFKEFSELFENDVYDAISLETCVNLRPHFR